jgi:Leucine-rich repeat (LRR) protein
MFRRALPDQLVRLPREIGNLINLLTLDLNNNKLVELPIEIFNIKNLRNLDLRNNKLIRITQNIGNLRQLKKLYLRNIGTDPLADPLGFVGLSPIN